MVPDPIRVCSTAKRGVDVELGPCGADKIQVCVYTAAMVQVDCFSDSCSTLEEGGWHDLEFPGSLSLSPGLYYLCVTATKNGISSRATQSFYVLP